ncbi:TetR/AcrR family transcriptional regulator [Kaistia defluvii]|uniref:TetR/AcrR family transcriptional regulator n=1 Tax=Kaistia defluvii TaxID=410841 RepID=UPI0022566BEF|nr:TetR/AcrR family transcriptional regulator [Kaistia defluvii]MCX5517944.1 TetR/AcrR family transcriptional regulator [Kaistia defluvii]
MTQLAQPEVTDLSPRESAQDARRTQILDAARTCFARSGFRGASMQEICLEAKMSPGGLYRYFPSKEAIIEAIAQEERCGAAELIETMRGTGPLLDRMMSCAMGYFAYMRDPGACELMAEISAESLRNSEIGKRFAQIDDSVRDIMREVFLEAIETGEMPPNADLDATISMLQAAVDGIALRQINDPDLSLARVEPLLRRLVAGVLGMKA